MEHLIACILCYNGVSPLAYHISCYYTAQNKKDSPSKESATRIFALFSFETLIYNISLAFVIRTRIHIRKFTLSSDSNNMHIYYTHYTHKYSIFVFFLCCLGEYEFEYLCVRVFVCSLCLRYLQNSH